jgi:hypothetical protein
VEQTLHPTDDSELKFDSTVPVFGTDQLDDMIEGQKRVAELKGEEVSVTEIMFGCGDHLDYGLNVYYEDKMILMVCPKCEQVKGQVEVSRNGRIIPMEYKN